MRYVNTDRAKICRPHDGVCRSLAVIAEPKTTYGWLTFEIAGMPVNASRKVQLQAGPQDIDFKAMYRFIIVVVILLFGPILLRVAVYAASDPQAHWSQADRSPVGLAPDPQSEPAAVVQVYAARAYRWRGIFAVHTWIAVKPKGAGRYTRYEVTGWGRPLRITAGHPDGRWVGNDPQLLFERRGPAAGAMIPKIEAAIAAYPFADRGGYTVWPGPNSNSFVAGIARAVPELDLTLPPNAVGKDFAPGWLSLLPTPSNTGWQVSLAGYAGIAVGKAEGLELHVLGQTLGIDVLRPALKFPALGRIGMAAQPG